MPCEGVNRVPLRQTGHIMQVFERTANKTEVDAALGLQPNATHLLEHLGFHEENLKYVLLRGFTPGGKLEEDAVGLSPFFRALFFSDLAVAQVLQMCHRTDIYEELKRITLDIPGDLLPVFMCVGCEFLYRSLEEGDVALEFGETVHADLVLGRMEFIALGTQGSDGRSRLLTRTHMLGHDQASPTGITCCRTVFKAPPEDGNISGLEWLTEGRVGVRTFYTETNGGRKMVGRNTRPLKPYLVAQPTPILQCQTQSRLSSPPITLAQVRAKFADYDAQVPPPAGPAEPTGRIYRSWLRKLPALPTWCNGRTPLFDGTVVARPGLHDSDRGRGVLAGLLSPQVDVTMAGLDRITRSVRVQNDAHCKLVEYVANSASRRAYMDQFPDGKKLDVKLE
ncbi:unnamed protein product [Mycena citricolor]|uniref:Uncharacterized protein n=1 Tax=Mycena citricolor TaxID=2018698 RepID=A0AAD2H2T6_9AGAR|nr:unnamed protein product [Mycena citricolor]